MTNGHWFYGLLGDVLGIYAIFISMSIASLFTIALILVGTYQV